MKLLGSLAVCCRTSRFYQRPALWVLSKASGAAAELVGSGYPSYLEMGKISVSTEPYRANRLPLLPSTLPIGLLGAVLLAGGTVHHTQYHHGYWSEGPEQSLHALAYPEALRDTPGA